MATSLLTARTEFAAALNQICTERGISPEIVLETIKSAILAAYKRDFGLDEESMYEVELDPQTGGAKIYKFIEGKEGEKTEVTPPGFGRIAAQAAKQVILQKIREAEKSAILDEYRGRVGTIVNGMILRFDGKDMICDIGRGQARMTPEEQVKGRQYNLNRRLALYISDIHDTMKGEQIIVSRAAPELVAGLFRREVPEISSGAVEVKKIAREAGNRSKVAVVSTQPGVDPVGSCVGQKGVRVQAVIDELDGEKIDVIQYSDDPEKFVIAALSPAENISVKLNKEKKEAIVTVPEDQLSLTIGRDGQNVRLASKLTGFKIEVKGKEEKIKATKTKKTETKVKTKKTKVKTSKTKGKLKKKK